MTKKTASEISELVYEAQEPIDETSGLDETNHSIEEGIPYTDAEKARIIRVVSGLFAFLGSSYILYANGFLNLNKHYNIQPEKAAICDTVIAPLQESMRNSCNQENFERGTVLKEISDKKNEVLEQYDCTPQEWQCKPSKPYDLDNSTYTVEFRYK